MAARLQNQKRGQEQPERFQAEPVFRGGAKDVSTNPTVHDLLTSNDRVYRPRAYADPQADGRWSGWLVFFPVGVGDVIATERETTQTTFEALAAWAAGLTPVYLEGALIRALELADQSSIIAQLEDAEYETLEHAERLETMAEAERAAATIDETAAIEARVDAERIRRERLVTERALATTEEMAATEAAEIHEGAAREARAVAADAARRSRAARAETTRTRPKKPRTAKRK